MAFVFVHGVNNRRDADYAKEELVRAAFLREYVAPSIGINPQHPIFAPYWGGHGVNFWAGLAVVPHSGHIETLGAAADDMPPSVGIAAMNGAVKSDDTLVTLARRRSDVAIDVLFDTLILDAQSETDILIAARAYQQAQQRLAETTTPWLQQASTEEVLDQILEVASPLGKAGTEESLGGTQLWSMLQEASKRLVLFGPDKLSHAVVGGTRRPVTEKIATFVGDAFHYLAERGDGTAPGAIASTVLLALQEAHELSRRSNEPLVVISHSFGGEIVYDILTHYAEGSDLEIDAWITVGSQVGLFEEMSLLWTSPGREDRKSTPTEAIPSPKRAKRWINIVDTNDVLGFLVVPTFSGHAPETVHDFEYNTGYPVTGAHSGYFKWPSFYKRLALRIQGKK